MNPTRREFLAAGAAVAFAPRAFAAPAIQSIEPAGMQVRECTLAGETRADDVFPAHPSGLQVARDKWLLLYSTRGFRGVDDDRTIVYQLRRDAPDGPVVKEGAFARTRNDWDPYGEGRKLSKQHGHVVAFGVPKGAVLGGKVPPHANAFVAKWYVNSRLLDRERNYLEHGTVPIQLAGPRRWVDWIQFRLNDREDDLEITQPVSRLRQKGFESGERFTSAEPVSSMNQSFTPAVPFNADASAWSDVMAFDDGRVATTRYAWNAEARRYEWIETGPLSAPAGLSEGSLVRMENSWVLSARVDKGGIAFMRCEDPFVALPRPVVIHDPATNSPVTAFRWGDGVLRVLTGDKGRRDPLYCWDVELDSGFRCVNRRVVFDSVAQGVKIRPASQPKVDMAKLLPAHGGRQIIIYRVSVRSFNHPYPNRPTIPIADADEKAACGIYTSRVTYAEPATSPWSFA